MQGFVAWVATRGRFFNTAVRVCRKIRGCGILEKERCGGFSDHFVVAADAGLDRDPHLVVLIGRRNSWIVEMVDDVPSELVTVLAGSEFLKMTIPEEIADTRQSTHRV